MSSGGDAFPLTSQERVISSSSWRSGQFSARAHARDESTSKKFSTKDTAERISSDDDESPPASSPTDGLTGATTSEYPEAALYRYRKAVCARQPAE